MIGILINYLAAIVIRISVWHACTKSCRLIAVLSDAAARQHIMPFFYASHPFTTKVSGEKQ